MNYVPVYNFTIYAGQTTIVPFAFDADFTGYDGWSCELRASPGGELYGYGAVTVDNAASGLITITFSAETTAAITTAEAEYDIFTIDPTGAVVKLVAGQRCPVVARITLTIPSEN